MAIDMPPMTLEDAQRLYDKPAYVQDIGAGEDATSAVDAMRLQKNQAAGARSQAILDTALDIGVKAGIAWQLANINKALAYHEREFDTVYDFSRLLIQGRVVPPVITEARDLYTQEGVYTLRLSGALYRIERQARFSSVAPSWREYVTFAPPGFDRATLMSALLPRNSEEKRVWELAVKDGWKQGVAQANLMLQYGMDRMNRDLQGMLRFQSFVREGKISLPAIAGAAIPVTQEGASMAVDETLLRITALPQFNGNTSVWRSTIASSPYADPAPAAVATPQPSAAQVARP